MEYFDIPRWGTCLLGSMEHQAKRKIVKPMAIAVAKKYLYWISTTEYIGMFYLWI